MGITIGICDDNPGQVALLHQYINSHPQAGEFSVIAATDTACFMASIQNRMPQLVFLDIDMGETSGIRLGEIIKAENEDSVLVYITAYEKYALEAFSVRAFHYLLKPLTKEKFDKVLEEGLRYIEKAQVKTESILTIKTKKEMIRLSFADIIFFEKMGHKIRIHTRDRDYYYYDNFTNLLCSLGTGFFIQCHQGYIASISQIRGFRDKTLFLCDDIDLPVSRTYADAVKNILAERLFSGKGDG